MRRAGHFTTFLSYEARNPCLRIGDVVPSLFFFVCLFVGRFGRALGQTHSLPGLGLSVGLCGLAMCVAVSVGYLISIAFHPHSFFFLLNDSIALPFTVCPSASLLSSIILGSMKMSSIKPKFCGEITFIVPSKSFIASDATLESAFLAERIL